MCYLQVHADGERPVLQVRVPDKHGAARHEVEASRHVHVALLPEGVQIVRAAGAPRLQLQAGHADAREVELRRGVGRQPPLVLVEDVVHVRVPPVEQRVAHRRLQRADHAHRLL